MTALTQSLQASEDGRHLHSGGVEMVPRKGWQCPSSRGPTVAVHCHSSSTSIVKPQVWQICCPTPLGPLSTAPKICLCSSSFLLCHTVSLVRRRSSRRPSSNFLFFFFFFSATRFSHSASRASGDPHFFQANSSTWYRRNSIMFANVDLCGFAFSRWGISS